MDIEITDRYDALGIKPPSPETCCLGQCEGTGFIPLYRPPNDKSLVIDEKLTPVELKLWEAAEAESPADDGWHFVVCPDCNGTGVK